MKRYKLTIMPDAQVDMDSIRRFYEINETPRRATMVMASIREKIAAVRERPFAYPQDTDYPAPEPNIRRAVVHGTFHLCYRINEDLIELLRIHPCAMNPSVKYSGQPVEDDTDA